MTRGIYSTAHADDVTVGLYKAGGDASTGYGVSLLTLNTDALLYSTFAVFFWLFSELREGLTRRWERLRTTTKKKPR